MRRTTVPFAAIPSVAIFVRHKDACPRKGDELYKNCRCSKHLRWSHGGRQFRQSAKTRTWSIAEERRRAVEDQFKAGALTKPVGPEQPESPALKTIAQAIEIFLSDKLSQG